MEALCTGVCVCVCSLRAIIMSHECLSLIRQLADDVAPFDRVILTSFGGNVAS